ncbi:hypothetical protein [Nocardia spumae]|uniref:hypothetical protein n=1 Tax=Nocardia spumae TaxID=2887190 RepID=UPI001D15B87B|nr:hypothetical protein [Nocardia spumae]
MSDEIRVDPDTLRQDGARLAELGDRVGHTYAELRRGLTVANGCWGDDDLGEAFAKDFTPHTDELLAGLRAMEESLRAAALQVANAAHEFESQDLGGADRIARPADDAPGPDPYNRTGAQPSPDPTSSPTPEAGKPAAATVSAPQGDRPAAQSPSGPGAAAQSTPGAAPGAPGPSSSRSDPQSSNPSTRAPDRQEDAKPGADPDRRSRPAGVTPPPTGRDVPRTPGADRSGTSGRNSGSTGAGRGTPWTGPASPTTRGPAAAEPNSSSPRSGAPSRPRKGDEQRKRDRRREPERADSRPGGSPFLAWLARALADRHGVAVTGFDLPGLQEPPVRQFAAAIDRVLTDYPMIGLDVVAVAEPDDDVDGVLWRRERRDCATVRSITLDRRIACPPEAEAETPESGTDFEASVVYTATVRELGVALSDAGGDVARRTAQHTLIAEYMRAAAGRYTTLAELLRGYRQWRAGLSGDSARFDTRRAVGAAFADVVLHRERAGAAAKALHAALVDAAPPPD